MRPPGPPGSQLAWVRATIEFRRSTLDLPLDWSAAPLRAAYLIEPARETWQRAVERAGYRNVYHPDYSPTVYHVSQHR